MAEKLQETRVQADKFWIWRINREENQLLKEFSSDQSGEANVKRLQESIIKARHVAENIKKKSVEKEARTRDL